MKITRRECEAIAGGVAALESCATLMKGKVSGESHAEIVEDARILRDFFLRLAKEPEVRDTREG